MVPNILVLIFQFKDFVKKFYVKSNWVRENCNMIYVQRFKEDLFKV